MKLITVPKVRKVFFNFMNRGLKKRNDSLKLNKEKSEKLRDKYNYETDPEVYNHICSGEPPF